MCFNNSQLWEWPKELLWPFDVNGLGLTLNNHLLLEKPAHLLRSPLEDLLKVVAMEIYLFISFCPAYRKRRSSLPPVLFPFHRPELVAMGKDELLGCFPPAEAEINPGRSVSIAKTPKVEFLKNLPQHPQSILHSPCWGIHEWMCAMYGFSTHK